jgi:hypothetical protein
VKEFKGLKRLSSLNLARTPVTGSSFDPLTDLRDTLRHLDLTGTKFFPNRVVDLRKALPYCTILY